MKWNGKAIAFVLAAMSLFAVFRWKGIDPESRLPGASYSKFLREVHDGKVDAVKIMPEGSGANPATYHTKDGSAARTVLPADYRDAIAAMQQGSVDIEIKDTSSGSLRPLVNAIPFLFLAGFWLFMMGKLRAGARIV